MRRLRTKAETVPVLLAVAAYALAFAQRPGWVSADTKLNLHVDPGRFLADVASMWTSSGQLGDVQTGQYAGYLFPMGPFFAGGHALGLSPWVLQRLWLGTLLTLAAWGVVRLLDALLGPGPRSGRGVALAVAGAATILNPLVVTYANRTTVTLLAYVVLPWLLLCVHRGMGEARHRSRLRRWRWPAAFALLVTASGGGVNAAVTAWMLLGPVLLALYEIRRPDVGPRELGALAARTALLTGLTSLWWVIPAYIQSSYGIDFLHFTEQPGTVWGTTSLPESLRLMSFWLSYVGIGFAGHAIPYFDTSPTLLFSLPVVLATLLVPALAIAALLWSRRWAYGPFCLALALLALLIMGAGFPDGTPLRHGLYFAYNHLPPLRFLRASYKAAPLLAVAVALLAGSAAGAAWEALARPPSRAPAIRVALLAGIAGLLALTAWPLSTGQAQDRQTSFRAVPDAWRLAARDLDRQLPTDSRAMVLPGELFSFYTWGGTGDPILPALSRRPIAERTEVPYADLRATDLLWTIDSLVHQRRLLPGQLSPLLSLAGIRAVLTGSDADLARSDAPPPADAAAELGGQPGFAVPARTYGPARWFARTSVGVPVRLPQVRRYDLPLARPLVRLESRRAPLLLDGSAPGLAELAAFGGLPANRAIAYVADLTPALVRAAAVSGATIAITDTNRRSAFVAGSLDQNLGPTLPPGQGVSADGLIFDPFGRGPGAETVATYTGIAAVSAPSSPEAPQRPEHAAFAAIDGSPATAWLADPTLGPESHWLEVDFRAPRPIPYVDLTPYAGTLRAVTIAGRRFAVHPGRNRLALRLRAARKLRVTLTQGASDAGISELAVPGLRAGEALRTPLDAYHALAGADLSHSELRFDFERVTGDDPFERQVGAPPLAAEELHAPLGLQDAGDAERLLHREFPVPTRRAFSVRAWVNPAAWAPDSRLDRVAGYAGPVQVDSSGRADGAPRWRGSRALDGNPETAWIAPWRAAGAWLSIAADRPLTVRALRLLPAPLPVRRASSLRVSWPGGATGALPVADDGVVALSRPIHADRLRLQILAARLPAGANAADARAVGIGEIEGISGLSPVREKAGSTIAGGCGAGAVQVGSHFVRLAIRAGRAAFDAGRPLPARGCGPPIILGSGTERLSVLPGPFAVDDVELRSPAPHLLPTQAAPGAVLSSGREGRGSIEGIRLRVTAPAWLVLGEGYDRGWRATCDGRSLGAPVPLDGYANAWPVGPGCRTATLDFAPQRLADGGYLVSALALLICLVLLAAGFRRSRRAGAASPSRPPAAGHLTPARLPASQSAAAGLLIGAAFGFVFGVQAGIAAVPMSSVILWAGVGARPLLAAAGLLLVVAVPLLYLVQAPSPAGGNHAGYPAEHLSAHWVAVAAFGLLLGALWRMLRRGPAASRRTAGHLDR